MALTMIKNDSLLPLNEDDHKAIKSINRGMKLHKIYNAVAGVGFVATPFIMAGQAGVFTDAAAVDGIKLAVDMLHQSAIMSMFYIMFEHVMFGNFAANISTESRYAKLLKDQQGKVDAEKRKYIEEESAAFVDRLNAKLAQQGAMPDDADYAVMAILPPEQLARITEPVSVARIMQEKDKFQGADPFTAYMKEPVSQSVTRSITNGLSPKGVFAFLGSMFVFAMPLFVLHSMRNDRPARAEEILHRMPPRPNLQKIAQTAPIF